MQRLESILDECAKRHKHLCPRQVLGARMSLLAGEALGLQLPRRDKRMLVIAEGEKYYDISEPPTPHWLPKLSIETLE